MACLGIKKSMLPFSKSIIVLYSSITAQSLDQIAIGLWPTLCHTFYFVIIDMLDLNQIINEE